MLYKHLRISSKLENWCIIEVSHFKSMNSNLNSFLGKCNKYLSGCAGKFHLFGFKATEITVTGNVFYNQCLWERDGKQINKWLSGLFFKVDFRPYHRASSEAAQHSTFLQYRFILHNEDYDHVLKYLLNDLKRMALYNFGVLKCNFCKRVTCVWIV